MQKWTTLVLMALLYIIPCSVLADGGSQDYSCRRAARAVTVDGDLSEWSQPGALPLMLVGGENVGIPSWRGPDDASVICWMMWDETNLYFAANVTDDVHYRPGPDGGMYGGDSFQIAFDPLDDSLIPGYDGNDIEIGLTDSHEGPAAWGWVGGQTGISGRIPQKYIRLAYRAGKDGKSGVFEAAISWDLVKPFKPQKGNRLGFNIIYNDNDADAEGRRGWLKWTPGIAEEKLPFIFRNIVLVDAGDGRTEPILTTDRKYYDDGQPVKFSCYVPWDRSDKAAAEVTLTVGTGEKTIFTDRRKIELLPGVNRIDFIYSMSKAPEKPLDGIMKIVSAGQTAPTILKVQILGLNVPLLKKQAVGLAARNKILREKLSQAEKSGREMSYPRVTAAIVDIHLKYRLQDLDNQDLLKRTQPLAEISRQFNYLDDAITRAENEVRDLVAHPDRIKPVPKIDMTDLVIKHGTFYKNDQPVMLFGPSGWWTVFNDLGWIAELGFNLVSGTTTPETVVPGPGQLRFDYLKSIADRMAWARGHNLAVDFLPSPHPMPKAWLDAFPDIKDYTGNGWMGASLYNPYVRRMVEEFWNTLIPYLADQPALAAWDVINEWSFSDGLDRIHPTMRIRFYNHLRERYGTIQVLNRQWKSGYENFEAIDPLKFGREKHIGAFYDWECFRHTESTGVMSFMKDIIRRYDVKTPIHVKIIAATDLNPEHYGPNGIDREAIDDVLDISGCDCGQPIHFDFYKSLHPAKPSIDSEVHTAVMMSPEEMRTSIWDAFLHGQSARILWAWENSHTAEHMAAGAILHLPWSLEAAGRTSLDLRRLAKEVAAFQRAIPRAPVAFLFSKPSLILDKKYPPLLRTAHGALFYLDTQTRFISERQIRDGGLEGVKLLVVPDAAFVEDQAVAKILAFAKAGGTVLASGEALLRDPYNNVRPKKEILDAGVKYFAVGETELGAWLDAAMDRAKIERSIRPVTTDGRRPANVEFRIVDDGKVTLAYLINHSGTDQTLTLKSNRKITRVRDRINERELTLPFRAARKDPMLLQIEL